jgi:hypothetical protein
MILGITVRCIVFVCYLILEYILYFLNELLLHYFVPHSKFGVTFHIHEPTRGLIMAQHFLNGKSVTLLESKTAVVLVFHINVIQKSRL